MQESNNLKINAITLLQNRIRELYSNNRDKEASRLALELNKLVMAYKANLNRFNNKEVL